MAILIDITAGIVLLFFFLSGWHKGLLLSLLGILRVILAYGCAYFAGRYIGVWLGAATCRPRIVTVPVIAILTFGTITFLFHILMSDIRHRHRERRKAEDYHHTLLSSLGGSTVNLAAGILSLILIFWLADLFLVGATGTGIPGAERARFSRFARRSIYAVSLRVLPAREQASQVAAQARMISNPGKAVQLLEQIVQAGTIRRMASDSELPADIMSGDPDRIRANPSFHRFCADRETQENLRDLGLLSGSETEMDLCRKLAAIGSNGRIREAVENLRSRDMLRTDRIPQLIRDPAFDAIIAELLR